MKGVKILDFSRVLAGPWASQQLADQGADVIKVEPPGGDETRGFGPVIDGHSTYFMALNRNKRSVVLDLHTPKGRARCDELLEWADVVIENFRPGVAQRLGLGWPALHRRFPALIYVAIHAFGEEGDPNWTKRPGYDLVLQAMGGTAASTGFPGPPIKYTASISDVISSLLAVQAVMLGLLHVRSGLPGEKIVINMLHAHATTLLYHATRTAVTGEVELQRGSAHAGLVPYRFFMCSDGWLALGCANDRLWQRTRECLRLPDKERWRKNVDRVTHREEVDRAIEQCLNVLSVAQADALLESAGVPAGPVLNMAQTLAHPAVNCIKLEHPAVGPVNVPGPCFQSVHTRKTHRAPPTLNGDMEAIAAEIPTKVTAQDGSRRGHDSPETDLDGARQADAPLNPTTAH